ncbi:unnamed protein product, partial [Scytosiphon promiscuus]
MTTEPRPPAMRSWSSALAPAAMMSLCGRSSVVSYGQFCWDASATSRRSKAALVVSTADFPVVRRRWRSSASSAAFLGGGSAGHADRRQQQRRSSAVARRSSLLATDIDIWRNHHSPQRFPRACPGRVAQKTNLALFESKRRSSTVHSAGGTNGDTYAGEYGGAKKDPLLDKVLASWPAALSPDGTDMTGKSSGSIGNGMSLAETTEQAASWLQLHDVVDPEPSASELLAKAMGFRSPQEMLARQQQQQRGTQGGEATELSRLQWEEFRRLCALRAVQHVPVQYLVGEWDFYGLSLEMQPPTLIPRPETEELVEIVLRWLRQDGIASAAEKFAAAPTAVNAEHSSGACGFGGLRFLDVGSGTGAIGLALLNELPTETTRCVAIDAQESAVRLSRRNAERTGLQAKYSCFHTGVAEFGTASAPAEKSGIETRSSYNPSKGISDRGGEERVGEGGDGLDFGGSFDFIVSNPPYIPRKDMEVLPRDVADHEDSVALDGGEDGLDVVRDIVRRCPSLLRKGGPRQLWMEVDTSHPEAMQRWL